MKYIIMCGGVYAGQVFQKQLLLVNEEPIIQRTIRLLRECGVNNIYISTNNPIFEKYGVPILHHQNKFGQGGHWVEAFYPTEEPACYICGDVIFSKEAINTIVSTKTDFIEFFASSPPFHPDYCKKWAEPYAMKVVNQKYFRSCIEETIRLADKGAFKREPIFWELWQVIKRTPINYINYYNYTTINDWSCDVDSLEEYQDIIKRGVIK